MIIFQQAYTVHDRANQEHSFELFLLGDDEKKITEKPYAGKKLVKYPTVVM